MDSSFRWNDGEEQSAGRIATVDIIRGVAVMGILAMNIVAFAMPYPAYSNPLAYGMEGPADLVSWFLGFVFVDGKMRGLFCFLFGASMLLMIERAEAADEPAAKLHFRRMAWLLLFGLLHFYLLWSGDILSLYAPVGLIAALFAWRSPASLLRIGVGLMLVQFMLFALFTHTFYDLSAAASAAGASAEDVRSWARMSEDYAIPAPDQLKKTLALYRGSYEGIVEHGLDRDRTTPIRSFLFVGWETLAYMLFGMAALKTGFLTGRWSDARYRRIAAIGFAITVPIEALLAWRIWAVDFSVPRLFGLSIAATVLVRPVMIVALTALIILLTRGDGPLTRRIAAAGRTAFSNYIGTSLVMTAIFYGWGLGLFGAFSRAELWFFVIGGWALMLLWSRPWLDRFRYGPLEWLWRSLVRLKPQPMLRRA